MELDLSKIMLTEPVIEEGKSDFELMSNVFDEIENTPVFQPPVSRVITGVKIVRKDDAITSETKRASHEQIEETLGERQKLVLQLLETFPEGATAKELSNQLYTLGLTMSPERNQTHPRLNELVGKGLVKVVGKKTCQFTNRKVAIYKSNK